MDGMVSITSTLTRQHKPRTHPTSNWRRKQGRTHPTSNWRRKQGRTQSNARPVTLAPSASDEDTSPTLPSSTAAPSRRHDRSERRRRAREAKKRLYRTNKKKCIQLILREESRLCEIPTSADLLSHFGILDHNPTNYRHTGSTLPSVQ